MYEGTAHTMCHNNGIRWLKEKQNICCNARSESMHVSGDGHTSAAHRALHVALLLVTVPVVEGHLQPPL